VDGDRTRLAQVVGNLLQNAAKFTPGGGSVRLALAIVGTAAEVRVRDSGIGIEPELLPHLFEPFRQVDSTLARSQGGLGLGLALVKELVGLHGGTVQATSDGKGTGTELTVRLPLATAPAREPASAPGASPRPRRILVVEDHVDGAESLRSVLDLEGHAVEVAHDGAQGIAQAREFRPDVVMCDIGLPGMSGYDVAREMREDPALRGAYLIALTGYALPEDQRRAMEAGFDAHVSKPPTIERLRSVIASAP
jgi:two-component system CheB/CheR fusion protein